MAKRKMIFKKTYKANTPLIRMDFAIGWLRQKGVSVYIVNTGLNDDHTEFITLKIDGVKP